MENVHSYMENVWKRCGKRTFSEILFCKGERLKNDTKGQLFSHRHTDRHTDMHFLPPIKSERIHPSRRAASQHMNTKRQLGVLVKQLAHQILNRRLVCLQQSFVLL